LKLARYPVKETKRKREELTSTKNSEPPAHFTILGPKIADEGFWILWENYPQIQDGRTKFTTKGGFSSSTNF
jgi:hypothetical protein